MENRKLILYISMSLDGFIATKDDDLSWLSIVEKEGEDYGYNSFNETTDTYIVGRITYEKILKLTGGVFPQAETHKCYILSREERENTDEITFNTPFIKLKAWPAKTFDTGLVQLHYQKTM